MVDAPRAVGDGDRQSRAVTMRLAGADVTDIARALNYPTEDACRTDIANALERRAVEQAETTQVMLRVAEADRLDRLQARLWQRINHENPDIAMKAADTIRRLIDQRCRLLNLYGRGDALALHLYQTPPGR